MIYAIINSFFFERYLFINTSVLSFYTFYLDLNLPVPRVQKIPLNVSKYRVKKKLKMLTICQRTPLFLHPI